MADQQQDAQRNRTSMGKLGDWMVADLRQSGICFAAIDEFFRNIRDPEIEPAWIEYLVRAKKEMGADGGTGIGNASLDFERFKRFWTLAHEIPSTDLMKPAKMRYLVAKYLAKDSFKSVGDELPAMQPAVEQQGIAPKEQLVRWMIADLRQSGIHDGALKTFVDEYKKRDVDQAWIEYKLRAQKEMGADDGTGIGNASLDLERFKRFWTLAKEIPDGDSHRATKLMYLAAKHLAKK